jgi:hypothetical protein
LAFRNLGDGESFELRHHQRLAFEGCQLLKRQAKPRSPLGVRITCGRWFMALAQRQEVVPPPPASPAQAQQDAEEPGTERPFFAKRVQPAIRVKDRIVEQVIAVGVRPRQPARGSDG